MSTIQGNISMANSPYPFRRAGKEALGWSRSVGGRLLGALGGLRDVRFHALEQFLCSLEGISSA